MSKGISANVGGSYQQAKASYVNVNGTWTKFGGGLSWATVSNTPTGTYTGDDGHTYAYYLFDSDGTLTVTTAGLLEVLLVSGGGGSFAVGPGYTVPGVGAYLVTGLHPFASGSMAVTVGNAGTYGEIERDTAKLTGEPSSIGTLTTGRPRYGSGSAAPKGGTYVSYITGTPLGVSGSVGHGSPHPTYGGGAPTGGNGQPGVVIAKTRLN